ncbi:MAG: lipocalin-like domain-containing protein [Chloroflexi bacterium]|nr:lipocalin-like domain-containing protein [Chloroflexota bacterium]
MSERRTNVDTSDNPLVGVWRLVASERLTADGEVSYLHGREAVGYIMYTPDGYMSVAIMRPGRPRFAATDMAEGTAEEKRTAAEGYLSYCGRYEFRDGRVFHHVEVSLFPNWIGTTQERHVELDGNRLILTTRPRLIAGREQTSRITWERA